MNKNTSCILYFRNKDECLQLVVLCDRSFEISELIQNIYRKASCLWFHTLPAHTWCLK